MNIVILQRQLFPYFGVMAVAGAIKQAGHSVVALIEAVEDDLLGALRQSSPDVVAFSVITSEHKWLAQMAGSVREMLPGVPIVVGGIHAVMYPDDIMNIPAVDYMCCGEGEEVFPRLLERLAQGHRSADGIAGMWYRDDGGAVVRQGVTELVADLDRFPEDRAVYYNRYPQVRQLSQKIFMSSRGCPFRCSFCANPYIMEIYRGRGKYVRRKSAEKFVQEVADVVRTYGAKSLFFCDDLFVFDLNWLKEFTRLYKTAVGAPFICTGRAGALTAEHAEVLAGAGCHTVSFGVETGNENLRKNVLNKNISDEDLFQCAKILKDAGIEVQTSNMFCLPDETVADAVSTIELNVKMGTNYMFTTLFLPFPKTELSEYCARKGLLKKDYSFEDMPKSFVVKSTLDIPGRQYIQNLHKVAHLCLRFPRLRRPLIALATKVKWDGLFFLFYLVGTFVRYQAERKLTLLQTVRYLWTYRKGY